MRRSKAVSATALAAGAALVLGACGGDGGGGNGDGGGDGDSMATAKGQQGDTISLPPNVQESERVVASTDRPFTAYNNQTADANNSYNTFALAPVLAGAFKLDGNNNVLLNGDVMESVEVTNEQPQEVTWNIKDGVTWSDGEAWDCDDFHLTWLSQSGAGGEDSPFLAAGTTGYDQIESLECPDPTTVVTTFGEPYVDYKNLFGMAVDVLPAHILEQETGIEDITAITPDSSQEQLQQVADFWNTEWNGFTKELMPGSGPYVIDSFERNQSITLTRNPEWVGNRPGPQEVVLRANSESTAQAQALENAEIQVVGTTQPDANAANRLQNLEAQGVTYGSSAENSSSFEHFDLNFELPIFQDEAVRQAFFQCVDRGEIVQKLIQPIDSEAEPRNSIVFSPGEQGFQDNYSEKTAGGAQKANQTLQNAGWTKDSDGVYTKDGERLEFSISHTDIPRRQQTVRLVQSQCEPAGMQINDDQDPNFLDARVSEGDYDVALFAWSSAPFKTDQQPIYSTDGGQNWQGVSNETVDEQFAQAVVQTSREDAIPYYQQADAALASEYATLPLFQMPTMWGFRGVDRMYFQSYHGPLWNVGEWERTDN